MENRKGSFLVFFIGLVVVATLLSVIFFSPHISSFRNDQQYTVYDSHVFYHIAQNYTPTEIPENAVSLRLNNLSYPIYLSGITRFFSGFDMPNIQYRGILVFNLVILIGIFSLFYFYFKPKNLDQSAMLGMMFLSPSILGFSLTLEREVFAAFFMALFLICLTIQTRMVKLFGASSALIVLFFVRPMMLLNLIMALCIYFFFQKIKQWSYFSKGSVIAFFVGLGLIGMTLISSFFNELFMGHLSNASSSGMGGMISALPAFLRFSVYSFFYFFLPLPLWGYFYEPFMFPYEWFLTVSGKFYLFLSIFVGLNYKYLFSTRFVTFLFSLCITMHAFTGGTLFNLRHRVNIEPVLILLVLSIIHLMYKECDSMQQAGRQVFKSLFYAAFIVVFLVFSLNGAYLGAKLFLS